jgi:hypothetical protein
MVGTPDVTVVRSEAMNLVRCSGWRNGPGMCSVAPDRKAAYGMPHALAWNIGTMARARSASVMPWTDAAITAIACR